MKTNSPGLFVYRHNKNGNFCIQRFGVDKDGFTTWVGDLVHLSKDQMRAEGLVVVRRCLSEFGRLDTSLESELMRMPPRERSRFTVAHACIGIDLKESSVLSFCPMQKTRGGVVGKAMDRFELRLPTTPARFHEALQEAFGRASDSARSVRDL